MNKDFDLSKITGREPPLLTEEELLAKEETASQWLELSKHPLDASMIGMWAWVRWTWDNGPGCQKGAEIEISEIYKFDDDSLGFASADTGDVTHYQLIGPAPAFEEK